MNHLAAALIELPTAAPEKKLPKRKRPRQKFARFTDDEAAEFECRAEAAGIDRCGIYPGIDYRGEGITPEPPPTSRRGGYASSAVT
jgi:hypothetical protein